MKTKTWLCAALIFVFAPRPACTASTYQCSILPEPTDNFLRAEFRLWLPSDIGKIQNLVILVPGWNQPGLNLGNDLSWQQLAKKWNCGLISCQWEGAAPSGFYDIAENGSGRALLEAVAILARDSGHNELNNSMLLLYGHSAGGQFAFSFICWKPEKVIAFAAVKGGFYEATPSDASREVLGLFIAGEYDLDYRIENTRDLVAQQKAKGALWTLAIEQRSGHEVGHACQFVQIYFDALLRLKPDSKMNYYKLGCRVDIDSGKILPISAVGGNTSWMPCETAAKAWLRLQGYIK